MTNAELITELRGHILSVPLTLLHDAADALEAADKRIAELMPKEGEWIWDIDGMDWGIGSWKCKNCHARPNTYWQCDSTINPLTFAGSSYCPNCGAKMNHKYCDVVNGCVMCDVELCNGKEKQE